MPGNCLQPAQIHLDLLRAAEWKQQVELLRRRIADLEYRRWHVAASVVLCGSQLHGDQGVLSEL